MPLFNRKMLNWCYWMYSTLFWCKRGINNTFFQEDQPRKKLEIEIPIPKYPWVYIAAVTEDNNELDVTEIVESTIKPGDVLTPDRLSEIIGIKNAIRWEYMSVSTFEVETISSDGIVNEVKWKSD